MVKRKEYRLRNGQIIDREEYHDGRYGGPGLKRKKKTKLTKEQMKAINMQNKVKRCRWRLLEYFTAGDVFATLTYRIDNRPANMEEALKDFQKAVRYIRAKYKKQGFELFWIRNIEQGAKGAWHIHLVLNEIGDTASILQRDWKKGGVWFTEIRKSKFYDEDFTKLANYLTKDENSVETKKDGKPGKPRLKSASYNISRNMPLPEAQVSKLHRWRQEPRAVKDYYIAKIQEGINPVTGYKYRRYTMFHLSDSGKGDRYRHGKYIDRFK